MASIQPTVQVIAIVRKYLIPFVRTVHPDFFGSVPRKQAINQTSLQTVNSIVGRIEDNKANHDSMLTKPVEVEFYLLNQEKSVCHSLGMHVRPSGLQQGIHTYQELHSTTQTPSIEKKDTVTTYHAGSDDQYLLEQHQKKIQSQYVHITPLMMRSVADKDQMDLHRFLTARSLLSLFGAAGQGLCVDDIARIENGIKRMIGMGDENAFRTYPRSSNRKNPKERFGNLLKQDIARTDRIVCDIQE
ncbi:hypothetical protein QVD99_007716 [Batrachochytrium dendrobatidis]|nr:hypothetical protein QVD99_007716 [Batrachochytrium dendrobatidis]